MATRITRHLAQSSEDSEGDPAPDISGSGVKTAPNLRKRLTAAVGRLYPGWTIRVTVLSWTALHTDVVIDGTRNPASGAPPAPPPGSTAAEKLTSRTAKVLERVLENQYPGSDWDTTAGYESAGPNNFQLRLSGERKVTDPPTCADGTVIYPVSVQESLTGSLSISMTTPNPSINLSPAPPDRWVFFRRRDNTTSQPSSLLASPTSSSWYSWDSTSNNWQVLPAASQPTTPQLLQGGSVVPLHNTDSFAYRLQQGESMTLNRGNNLARWYVWSRP